MATPTYPRLGALSAQQSRAVKGAIRASSSSSRPEGAGVGHLGIHAKQGYARGLCLDRNGYRRRLPQPPGRQRRRHEELFLRHAG